MMVSSRDQAANAAGSYQENKDDQQANDDTRKPELEEVGEAEEQASAQAPPPPPLLPRSPRAKPHARPWTLEDDQLLIQKVLAGNHNSL